MGNYTKPKCDCGKPLVLKEILDWEITWHINKEGIKSKILRENSRDYNDEYFQCESCGNCYHINEDTEDRFIRGEKIE